MDEIGPRQHAAAPERGPQAGALDDRCGDGETGEREPGERGQDEDAREDRRRQVDEEPDREREPEPPRRHGLGRNERDRGHIGDGQEDRAAGQGEDQPRGAVELGDGQGGDRRRDSERERAPEVGAVEADRLGDELADRPLRGGKRRRQRLRGAGRHPRKATERRLPES